jgi:hypothetical protein
MDLRMTYDLTGKFPIKNFSDAAQGISYIFKIKSPSPLENVIKVAQASDKGCHTVNSMRQRIPVSGSRGADKLVFLRNCCLSKMPNWDLL